MKKIVIVGLGLIGGSMAMALKGFEDFTVEGVVRRQETLDFALAHGVGDTATLDAEGAIRSADVVFLAMNPKEIVRYLADHRDWFKPGALVTDVCGIKTAIMEGAQVLPEGVDFIGCHPMAGTEHSGIEFAFPEMFRGAHFIITPRESSTPAHIALMERMADYLGCRDVVNTTPEKHDAIIAYTSQVMHVMAVSICDDPQLYSCRGFEGSSFRDCTRVAALDVDLWTELFSMNSKALCQIIERLEVSLHSYRLAIEFAASHGDSTPLEEKLTYSSNRKRKMNLE